MSPRTPSASLEVPAGLLPSGLAERVLTPALVIRLERVRANVARIVEMLGGRPERWRPHVKTTKLPIVWRELLQANVRRFKCATTREADVLARTLEEAGVADGDVLLAYPLVGPALGRLARVAAAHPSVRFSVLVEDERTAASLPEGLGAFVDVNPGMHRTGIPLADGERVLAVARAAGRRLRGLSAYEGHLYQADRAERRRAVHAVHASLLALAVRLRVEGIELAELVTTGTPALLDALAHPGLAALAAASAPARAHEDGVALAGGDGAELERAGLAALAGTRHTVSPGTVVLHDARSAEETPELGLVPAATVLARVVSRPAPDVATVDAGSKALAAEAGDPCAVVLGHEDWRALAPSEEHLPFQVPAGLAPERGALVQLVPRHVCPTVNLHDEALVLDGAELVGVVAVEARGHELLPDG